MAVDKTGIWGSWLKMWNGDFTIADELISPELVTHFVAMSPEQGEVRGGEDFKRWMQASLTGFADARYETEVGPIAEDDKIVGRWNFTGTYQGGTPDAAGKQISFHGIDIIRIADGKVVEYWLCADTMSLMQQIGMIPS